MKGLAAAKLEQALPPVSVVIISLNEEERIEECLKSASWADEIIVVDAGSSDATCDIARRYTDRVHHIPWKGFGPQKQAGVELASNDWIFNLDCDERVTPELADEIRTLVAAGGSGVAYTVPRRTFIGSKEIRHSGWYPDRTIRLFDRRSARFSDNLVHERVVTDGRTGECRGHLLHYSFSGFQPLLTKINRYSDLSAEQMLQNGRRCSLFDLTLRPFIAFLKTYALKRGFLDGVEGLEIAVTTALLTFTKYVKLRELGLKHPDRQP